MPDCYLKLAAAAAAAGYLSLVFALRWRKYDEVHRKYQHRLPDKRDAQGLTPAEAQDVVHLALGWDMPFLMTMALEFALFQTYAVPSISKLLLATRELASRETVSKRVADTELLLTTWATCPINGYFPGATNDPGQPIDPRAALSLARVNWLHSKYNISWAEKYGWRSFSDLEKHAWFVYWVEIGKRMNIKDIPPTFEALSEWREQYEKEHMKPAPSNAKVAKFTADELLFPFPKAFGIKEFGRRVTVCLMSERVRVAMMEEAQPWFMHAATLGALRALAFWNKYLMLPRRKMTSLVEIDMPRVDPATGKVRRMHPLVFQSRPWYMPQPEGFLSGIVTRLSVFFGIREFPPGPQFESEGYNIQEMGPAKFKDEGHDEIEEAASALLGCPIPKAYRMRDTKE
uniref:ER-bound oxygenase mpaB/mpaB'/Rubber oxygenase catalytic domain-containing protein n=1 Tax=Schizophyllum commune (strain H4-8 / FGSC 9210) TaxID=578458 RepID=D8Q7B7_SCHCM